MQRIMLTLAKAMAVLGGIVLSILILLTCASIVGREMNAFLNGDFMQSTAPGLADALLATGIGPVNGDFELVEAGVAFAIFAFLPLCQITSAHASVDVFTNHFPERVKRFLRMVIEILFGLVLLLIAWRLYDGMLSKMRYNETTFLLQFPIWWAYAASFAGACVASVVGVYMAIVRTVEFFIDRTIVADGPEADH